jgi:hypothetical protein
VELKIKNAFLGDPKMAKQDAKTEYETAKSDIANLLGFFECELGKTPQEIDWTHVGSLRHVRENLIETLSFMSGIEVKEIESTLQETRLEEKGTLR